MIRPPPSTTRTATLFPSTTRFRSQFNDHPYDAAIYHALQFWPHTRGIKLFDEEMLVPVCHPDTAARIRHHPAGLTAVAHIHMASRPDAWRSEEHTSELQSLMRISYAVFCLKKKTRHKTDITR